MQKLIKRCISLFLVSSIILCTFPVSAFAESSSDSESWWKKIASKASDVADTVSETAVSVYGSAKEAISKLFTENFKKGWEMSAGFLGASVASLGGQQYVNSVSDAIQNLQTNINNRASNFGSGVAQKAGFVAEEWHAGTYNIDAIARGLDSVAETGKSNALGSADISIGGDLDAGLKYFATAEDSAKMQARITQDSQGLFGKYNEYISRTNDTISFDDWLSSTKINLDDCPDLYWEVYQNQVRIIPADQIDDAIKFLERAIAKESANSNPNRQAVAKSYEDTLKNLKDRLTTADGTESIPLSKKDAEAIAKAGKDNNFKPSEFGVTTTNVIKADYVAKQAIKAGATSAIIEAALVLGPQIFEIIKHLVDTGELDMEQLKSTGLDGLSAAADGYLKGSISNALVIMSKAGKLGAAYTSASPELIGAMTVLVVDAVKYGIKLANGEISTEQYADIMAQELIVSAATLGSAALVGLLFPQASLAICLGSFVGGLIASAGYPAAKEYVLAVIDSADVDMIVPVQNTAEALKGKTAVISASILDAISSIKGIDTSAIKGKTMKVFDFT